MSEETQISGLSQSELWGPQENNAQTAVEEAVSGLVNEINYDIWKWYEYGEGEEPLGFGGLAEQFMATLNAHGFKVEPL